MRNSMIGGPAAAAFDVANRWKKYWTIGGMASNLRYLDLKDRRCLPVTSHGKQDNVDTLLSH